MEGSTVMGNVINHHNKRADFKEIVGILASLPTKSKIWGLHWTFLETMSWCIWRERNNRWKKNKASAKEVILRNCMGMKEFGYVESKFKKCHNSRKFDQAMHTWEAYNLIMHDVTQ